MNITLQITPESADELGRIVALLTDAKLTLAPLDAAVVKATTEAEAEAPKAKPKAKPKRNKTRTPVQKANAQAALSEQQEIDAEREAIQAEGEASGEVDRKQLETDLRAIMQRIGPEKMREAKASAGITARLQSAEGDALVAYRKFADQLEADTREEI